VQEKVVHRFDVFAEQPHGLASFRGHLNAFAPAAVAPWCST
jgi:hypothetical protein